MLQKFIGRKLWNKWNCFWATQTKLKQLRRDCRENIVAREDAAAAAEATTAAEKKEKSSKNVHEPQKRWTFSETILSSDPLNRSNFSPLKLYRLLLPNIFLCTINNGFDPYAAAE